jgi:hypothetical protein
MARYSVKSRDMVNYGALQLSKLKIVWIHISMRTISFFTYHFLSHFVLTPDYDETDNKGGTPFCGVGGALDL